MIATKQWVKNLLSKVLKKAVASNNYSFEEQRIGTWVDGKPLYQKTIKVVPTNQESYFDLEVDNLDVCYVYDGYCVYDGVQYCMLDYLSQVCCSIFNLKLNIYVAGDPGFRNIPYIVTIRYTKTTDTATN